MPVSGVELAHIRFTSRASVAPDGSAVAHIVDDGGYPRAVQRFLSGRHASMARWVTLPVAGPVTKVAYSPDSRWLACQLAPYAGTRTQVWLVTNDPEDPSAWRLGSAEDSTVELVGWDGARVAVAAADARGEIESRLIDPHTQHVDVIDRRRLARLVDSWQGNALLRVGPRGYREVVLLRRGHPLTPLLGPDPGSVTDAGVILDPRRARSATGGRRLSIDPDLDVERPLRVLLRSDAGCEFPRLVEVVVSPDGRTSSRVLAERPDAGLEEFVVSDDTSTAAVLWNCGGVSELQILDLASGALDDPITLPGLVASQLSICATGEVLAVTVEGPGMPPSVELVGAHSKLWRPVEPAFLEVDWSHAPVRHEFPARDGIRLSGWLHGPRGAAGPGPVLLYLHGGPEAEERPGYSYLFPDLVDAGITVFAPNVRGSAGSGRAFGHADERELRFAGIDDVADCVDYLVAAGIADPARVGCTGRSYGGYLTYASLIHHRDRFAAGMAICGMSDLESFYANTEPWIAEAAHSKYGHPEHDRDLLRELSPIHRIDELEAPLLVVHGAHDSNVPVSESEQLVAAVRARGGVAEFLLLPDEGHEIVTRENHERLAAAMVAWFADRL